MNINQNGRGSTFSRQQESEGAEMQSRSRSPAIHSSPHQEPATVKHPATAAGLMRIDYFNTDLWVIGGKEYITPKNTVPSILEKAFLPSESGDAPPITMRYDRSKFAVDRLTGTEPGREHFSWVHSYTAGKGIVDVTLRDDTFVVELFKGAHNQQFPFTKEEFLNALQASKVDVELDQLEDDDSASESETERP